MEFWRKLDNPVDQNKRVGGTFAQNTKIKVQGIKTGSFTHDQRHFKLLSYIFIKNALKLLKNR